MPEIDAKANSLSYESLRASEVYFIKLGRAGRWEDYCLDNAKIKFGYEATPEALVKEERWEDIKRFWMEQKEKPATVAASFSRQIRLFHATSDVAVFITFARGKMYWCRAASGVTWNEDGTTERDAIGGWSGLSLAGAPLMTSSLSGGLLSVQMYRQTICRVAASDYAIRKITDTPLPDVVTAINAVNDLRAALLMLIKKLGPKDFELLLDLIFLSSGWRRQTPVGKSQPVTDFDLYLPTTQEHAFVQVKSRASQADLDESIEALVSSEGYHRLFFAYHTGHVVLPQEYFSRVTLIGPERVSEMALDAGLATWVLSRIV